MPAARRQLLVRDKEGIGFRHPAHHHQGVGVVVLPRPEPRFVDPVVALHPQHRYQRADDAVVVGLRLGHLGLGQAKGQQHGGVAVARGGAALQMVGGGVPVPAEGMDLGSAPVQERPQEFDSGLLLHGHRVLHRRQGVVPGSQREVGPGQPPLRPQGDALRTVGELRGNGSGQLGPGFFHPVHGQMEPPLAHVDALVLRAVFRQAVRGLVTLAGLGVTAHGAQPQPFDGLRLHCRRAARRSQAPGPLRPGSRGPARGSGPGRAGPAAGRSLQPSRPRWQGRRWSTPSGAARPPAPGVPGERQGSRGRRRSADWARRIPGRQAPPRHGGARRRPPWRRRP